MIEPPRSPKPPPHVVSPGPGQYLKVTPEGHGIFWLHHTADENKGAEWRRRKRQEFTSEAMFRQEIDIDHNALTGEIVFPEFDRAVHVVPKERVPRELTIYCSIDPHPRTPTATLWIGVDRWDDLWVFRELWPSKVYAVKKQISDSDEEEQVNVRDYAEAIAWLEGNEIVRHNPETGREYWVYKRMPDGERIAARYMDQAGKGFIAEKSEDHEISLAKSFQQFGIQCKDPKKKRVSGYDAIHDALRMRKHNVYGEWPRLHFSTDVPEAILEMEMLRWKKRTGSLEEEELWQKAVKARRHMIDNLRYLLTAAPRFIESLASFRYEVSSHA